MKVLIISDTHLKYGIEDLYYALKPDFIIHAGDSQLNTKSEELKHVNYIVKGNCDFTKDFNEHEIINIDNLNVFLTHGHKYAVNYGLEDLANTAKDNNCNISIFGHTHEVCVKNIGGITCINPGSFSKSRSSYPETFMILDTTSKELNLLDARNNQIIETFNL